MNNFFTLEQMKDCWNAGEAFYLHSIGGGNPTPNREEYLASLQVVKVVDTSYGGSSGFNDYILSNGKTITCRTSEIDGLLKAENASVEPVEVMRWVKASERLPYSVSDVMVRWIKDKRHCPDLLLFILKNKFLDELEWLDENTNQ